MKQRVEVKQMANSGGHSLRIYKVFKVTKANEESLLAFARLSKPSGPATMAFTFPQDSVAVEVENEEALKVESIVKERLSDLENEIEKQQQSKKMTCLYDYNEVNPRYRQAVYMEERMGKRDYHFLYSMKGNNNFVFFDTGTGPTASNNRPYDKFRSLAHKHLDNPQQAQAIFHFRRMLLNLKNLQETYRTLKNDPASTAAQTVFDYHDFETSHTYLRELIDSRDGQKGIKEITSCIEEVSISFKENRRLFINMVDSLPQSEAVYERLFGFNS